MRGKCDWLSNHFNIVLDENADAGNSFSSTLEQFDIRWLGRKILFTFDAATFTRPKALEIIEMNASDT